MRTLSNFLLNKTRNTCSVKKEAIKFQNRYFFTHFNTMSLVA